MGYHLSAVVLLVFCAVLRSEGVDIGIVLLLEYNDREGGSAASIAARQAVDNLNADPVLTRNGQNRLVLTSLVLTDLYPETQSSDGDAGPTSFNQSWVGNNYFAYAALVRALQARPQAAVVGPYLSSVSLDLRVAADFFQVPVITPTAKDPYLTHGAGYFLQPITSDDHHSEFFQRTMQHLSWRRVAVIYSGTAEGVNGAQHFLSRCLQNGVLLLGSFALGNGKSLRDALVQFRNSQATIFFVLAPKHVADHVVAEAHALGMMRSHYVWIIQGLTSYEPTAFDNIYLNVVTAGSVANASRLTQYINNVWRADPVNHLAEDDPDQDTIAVYDVVTATGKALLSMPTPPASGGHFLRGAGPFELNHKYADGPRVRQAVIDTPHSGVFLNISYNSKGRLSDWKVQGTQLKWDSGAGSVHHVPFGEVEGKDELWNSADAVFNESSLSWNDPASSVPFPGDRPPIRDITIRVLVSNLSWPFCHQSRDVIPGVQEGLQVVDGFACDVFKTMQAQLGFRVNITILELTDFEMVHEIALGNYDVAVGHIAIHPAITEFAHNESTRALIAANVEYTHPYWSTGVVSVGRVSDSVANDDIWHFVNPFHADMWLLWLGWVVAAAILFFLFERSANEDLADVETSEAVVLSLWFAFTASIACQDMTPKTRAGKLSAWGLYFITMLVIAAYTANLAAFLVAIPPTSGPLVTDIGITVDPSLVGLEVDSVASDILAAQGKRLTYFTDKRVELLAEKVVNSELKMLVEEVPLAHYVANEWGESRNCPLRIFGDTLGQLSYSLAVSRSWGYTAELSRALVKITSAQDSTKTDLKSFYNLYFTNGLCPVQGPAPPVHAKITAADMGGAFVCYAAVVGVSLIIYAAETLLRPSTVTPMVEGVSSLPQQDKSDPSGDEDLEMTQKDSLQALAQKVDELANMIRRAEKQQPSKENTDAVIMPAE